MPFLFCFCGYEKLCFLKFLLTFLIIEFSEGNPPPSAKNKWAAQAFLCSDICPSFKKWGQFVRRQLKHVFRIEASKVSPSCLSKFAFFFCHPHATKKTCLKEKDLEFAMATIIHICPSQEIRCWIISTRLNELHFKANEVIWLQFLRTMTWFHSIKTWLFGVSFELFLSPCQQGWPKQWCHLLYYWTPKYLPLSEDRTQRQ